MHYSAAIQYFEREGHPTVPRQHVEAITLGGESEDQAQRSVELPA
ncbi:hypothetical protein [Streptomyces sp. ISL-66]|nr:hypothetical protein [Streptomyces sp. ISL-66]